MNGERKFFGHPGGLATLFFTEMWERFSYYGMRAFLILYMVHALGFDDRHAGRVYGNYTAGVWAAAIVGGIIADWWLGQYRSVLIGGIIIAVGHFTLAFHPLPFFYTGLSLIVVGTGLLKPNVSGIVGVLYEPDDARRDAGFSIFYMGINLGAVIGPVFAWLWIRLGKYEPTTPTKFAFGLFFVGLSFLFLLIPASAIQGTPGLRVSPFWLVGCYFIQELGELCISPVGLSVFTKLAPVKI